MQDKHYERAISPIQAARHAMAIQPILPPSPLERQRRLEEFRKAAMRGAARIAGQTGLAQDGPSPLLPAIIRTKFKK